MIYFAKNPLPKKYKKVRQYPKKDLYILGSQDIVKYPTVRYNIQSQLYLQNSSEEYLENSIDLENIQNARPIETRYYFLGGKTSDQVFPSECKECELTDYDCELGQHLDLESCLCVDGPGVNSYAFDLKTQSWILSK